MKKRTIMLMLAALAVMATAVCASAASDIVGFIDAQRILVAHPKYEALQKQLDDFVQKKSEEARAAAEKEQDPQKRMQIIESARNESGAEESRVMNPITNEINGVIEKVAKSKGVTIVLNKMVIYFGAIDLTDDVIKGVKALK